MVAWPTGGCIHDFCVLACAYFTGLRADCMRQKAKL